MDAVDTGLVVKVLGPIWITKNETASRLRGRIETILDWARVAGHRAPGPNPAVWKGNLKHMLAPRKKVRGLEHHPALPYARAHEFMHDVARRPGIAALALRFTVLTAVRAGEVFGMTWAEVDLGAGLWTIPKERMKGGRQHRVPLSDQAQAVLRQVIGTGKLGEGRLAAHRYVFAGNQPGRPLSNMSMLALIKRMNCQCAVDGLPKWMDPDGNDAVPHGFRSTFKDWATDWTPSPAEIVEAARRGEIVEAFPRDLVEVALAHALDDKTEEAYRRTEMLEKRRRLMARWADFCTRPVAAGDVAPLRKEAAVAATA